MPPETFQHKGSSAWKVIATVLIVIPLTLMTCGFSLMAVLMGLGALMGSGVPAVGALLLGLASLAGWYLYSLIASFWLDRRSAVSVKRSPVERMVRCVAGGINYGSYGSKCLEYFETGRGGPRELSCGTTRGDPG